MLRVILTALVVGRLIPVIHSPVIKTSMPGVVVLEVSTRDHGPSDLEENVGRDGWTGSRLIQRR